MADNAILTLPPELLLRIATYTLIPSPSPATVIRSTIALASTCSTLHAVVAIPSLWKTAARTLLSSPAPSLSTESTFFDCIWSGYCPDDSRATSTPSSSADDPYELPEEYLYPDDASPSSRFSSFLGPDAGGIVFLSRVWVDGVFKRSLADGLLNPDWTMRRGATPDLAWYDNDDYMVFTQRNQGIELACTCGAAPHDARNFLYQQLRETILLLGIDHECGFLLWGRMASTDAAAVIAAASRFPPNAQCPNSNVITDPLELITAAAQHLHCRGRTYSIPCPSCPPGLGNNSIPISRSHELGEEPLELYVCPRGHIWGTFIHWCM